MTHSKIAIGGQWSWLKHDCLRRESNLNSCNGKQKWSIRPNAVKKKIDETQNNSKCRLFGKADETVSHVVSECGKLVQKKYR